MIIRRELMFTRGELVCRELVRGELVRGEQLFAANSCLRRTSFAANARKRWLGFLPANKFSGEPFASSRRSMRELGRTRANIRRSLPECGCRRTAGEFARSSPEYTRVRSSSRRTIVRRVYSLRTGHFIGLAVYAVVVSTYTSAHVSADGLHVTMLIKEEMIWPVLFLSCCDSSPLPRSIRYVP